MEIECGMQGELGICTCESELAETGSGRGRRQITLQARASGLPTRSSGESLAQLVEMAKSLYFCIILQWTWLPRKTGLLRKRLSVTLNELTARSCLLTSEAKPSVEGEGSISPCPP